MASNSFDKVLYDLLGEELYRDLEFDLADHTPTASLGVSAHGCFDQGTEGGAGCNWDLDNVFLEASEQFEQSRLTEDKPTIATSGQRFATPKNDEEVEMARKARIPKKTQADTRYCLDMWSKWTRYRNSVVDSEHVAEDITSLDNSKLQYWMSRFVLEVRKKDGSEYPPNTLHHIVCGILRHLRESGRVEIDFFKDIAFAGFRSTLDGEMKRLQSLGIGAKRRQAEPLTEEEEEKLWQTGQLGDHSPQALVDTMLFMHGIYFALRSGHEHRNLRFEPAQVDLVDRAGERAYVRYTEDISKNNPGGLKGRKNKPKVVTHYENSENPSRCFVRLFRLYQSKCPNSRPKDSFYLKPLKNPTEHCWYAPRAIGHHTLDNTVSRICKAAGIKGFKTNHSLRVTTATRLFQAGVDEQLIMERTGHHSTDGIRTYKRSSAQQQEAISDILSRSKKLKEHVPESAALVPASTSLVARDPSNMQMSSQQSMINHSQKQVIFHPDNLQRMFTFNSCTDINISVHIQ